MPEYIERPLTVRAEKISELLERNQDNFNSLPDWVKMLVYNKSVVFGHNNLHMFTDDGAVYGTGDDYLVEDTLSLDRKAYIVNGKYFEAKYELTNGTVGN